MAESKRLFADMVLNSVREEVLAGKYKAGERLSEVRLARRFGTSRSPVREALQSLAKEGLIRIVPRRGAVVAQYDLQEIEDLFQVRESIDGMAARLAALRAEPMHIQRLVDTLEMTKHILMQNDLPTYPLDLDFHQKILDSSKNARLINLGYDLHHQLRLARSRSAYRSARAPEAYEEHCLILEAIKARNPDRAEEAMRWHVRKALKNIQVMFSGQKGRDK
ncbi:MAG: GntR family transcriptional regulator [Thermodesulfobacteriota bacterium]